MNFLTDKPLYSQARTEPTDPSLIPPPAVVKCAYPPCQETFTLHDKSRRRYHSKDCVQKHRRDKEVERGRHRRAAIASHPKPINPLIAGDAFGNVLRYPDVNSWVAAWNAEHPKGPRKPQSDVCMRYAPENAA